MSVAEMQQYVVENVSRIDNPEKLEQLIQLIEQEVAPTISVEQLWEEIVSNHDSVMQRLAQ